MSEKPIITEDNHMHETEPDQVAQLADPHAHKVKQALLDKRIRGMSKPKKIIGLLIVALLVVGAAVYGVQRWISPAEKVEYATLAVGKGTVTDSIEVTGTLEAVRTTDMGFKNDDTIIALNVQPGDHVTDGQVLAEQDPATLQAALQQAQNTVEQDQINLATAQINLETNRVQLERQQELYAADAISQSELETAQTTYDKSELDLQLAQAKLASDQAKLTQAKEDMAETAIRAPFDGIIGAVNGQVGSINGLNTASSTLLTIMSDELQMNSLVNEADIGRVQIGQAVEFTSSSFSDNIFTGQVVRITPQATTVSNVQYYPVLIDINDPEGLLMAGMSVSAQIIVNRENDTVTVPMMAITYGQSLQEKESTQEASASVNNTVVVLENNQPVIKTVELGISDGTNYAVKSGLSAGALVVIGTNQTSSSSGTASSNNTNNANGSSQNRMPGGDMGGMPGGNMGGPPGGF